MTTQESRRSYEMFSKAGDYAVRRMVDKIVRDGETGKLMRRDLVAAVEAGTQKVSDSGHVEVGDTAVRECVWWEINRRLCRPQGWAEA